MGVISFASLDNPVDSCSCRWGFVKCPNIPEFIVIGVAKKIMFSIMCEPHKIDFEEDYGPPEGKYTVEPYTLERATELNNKARLETNSSTTN